MSHTVPNNLPQIFRHGRSPHGPWNGFFPQGVRRMSPDQQLRLSDYRPETDFRNVAERLKSPRLAEGFLQEDVRVRPLLLFLAALARSSKTDEKLILELGVTIFEFRGLSETARRLELIDERRHLTDQGRAVLHHAGLRARDVRFRLQGNDTPYYPRSLRGIHDV